MKIDARNPFLVFQGRETELIKESFPKHRFEKLQAIFKYFTGQLQKEQFPEDLKRMNDHQLESYFNHHCTVLFGDLLCQLGAKYQAASPTIRFCFLKPEDKTIWYCEECGSQNVELKQWILPNDMDIPAGNDSFDRNDRWCQDCEEHTGLETCKESEYPAILERIKQEQKESLIETQDRIQIHLANNGVDSVKLDTHVITTCGMVSCVKLLSVELQGGDSIDYDAFNQDDLERIDDALMLQIKTNNEKKI